MLDDKEHLEDYRQQLLELDKKGLLPRLDVNLNYKVYSIRKSGFGAHKSIVLTTDDEHFVTVELGLITINETKHIYPVAQELPKSSKSKLEFHGTITAKGEDLVVKAVTVMKKFGSYFKFCNNCQDYCNYYLEEISLKQAQSLTDGDKAPVAAIATAIIAFLFALMK